MIGQIGEQREPMPSCKQYVAESGQGDGIQVNRQIITGCRLNEPCTFSFCLGIGNKQSVLHSLSNQSEYKLPFTILVYRYVKY
jgi:hypothetical protein